MYQSSPPLSPRETLPTMYDLPSEDPEEPGLPDEFHLLQPELLRQTFLPPSYEAADFFTASDLNLYYDVHHPQWYKRPDWFGVLGVSRLYDQRDLRLSYVIWQEGIAPLVVVELLSPGTEKEDLGRSLRDASQPPNKWTVYEQILRIPYYFVFDRYTDELQAFGLVQGIYQPLVLEEPGIWLAKAQLGLGLWRGTYQGINRLWLRWYDKHHHWILTPAEQEAQRAEQEAQRAAREAQRAEQEKSRADRLAAKLRELGLDPDKV
ncbi:Uma2 family endonuclease [Synechocystis sp. FACHB-383]|uniref:Uma2 family endonuclease n=1 Tax=Synechocystis sp. FACHB-383 TaxID=2692864 RepID=UPI001685FF16|nr:Uma2 family endonuclease [Synechocystis sp. FACHB-383]MBD2654659.1 Uma2 family endonuclease [Synechocystis sp. FACHB-383]